MVAALKYQQKNGVILRVDVDGGKLLFDPETQDLYAVSAVGAHIWERLEKSRSLTELVQELQVLYPEQPARQLKADCVSFLSQLETSGLLVAK